MKSKKILLGVLMALAIGTSAFNLFGAEEETDIIGWIIVKDVDYGYICVTSSTPQFDTIDECLQYLRGGNF